MDATNLSAATQWVLAHGYLLMFLLMLAEGPVVTAAGAFAAALGYFNVWLVLTLSILGNLVPDAIYYAIGYWGRKGIVDKYGRYFHITEERMERLEKSYEKHAGKTLLFVKLAPLFATPGLVAAGIARVPIKKYTLWSFIVTAPSSLFYLIVGYYFGAAYNKVVEFANYGSYILAMAIVVFITLSYLQKKYGKKLAEKIEEG